MLKNMVKYRGAGGAVFPLGAFLSMTVICAINLKTLAVHRANTI